MRLKGGQICATNSFKARRVFETAPGPVLCRQKGPKRFPKWTQNGVQKRIHFQTFLCINLGPLLAPFGDPKWTQFETQQQGEDEGKDDKWERQNDGKTLEKQHILANVQFWRSPKIGYKKTKTQVRKQDANCTRFGCILAHFGRPFGCPKRDQNGDKNEDEIGAPKRRLRGSKRRRHRDEAGPLYA